MRLLAVILLQVALNPEALAVGDNSRNNSERVPPGIEQGICQDNPVKGRSPARHLQSRSLSFLHTGPADSVKRPLLAVKTGRELADRCTDRARETLCFKAHCVHSSCCQSLSDCTVHSFQRLSILIGPAKWRTRISFRHFQLGR